MQPAPAISDDSAQRQWASEPRTITRSINDQDGEPTELDLVLIDGIWCEASSPERDPPIPIPGARSMTVAELVADRFRTERRSGVWIELRRDVAHAHPELLEWCRRRCNTELPAGGFRFAPRTWEDHSRDELTVPFVPELDDPDAVIRRLAMVERFRRRAEQDQRIFRQDRRQLVQDASETGHSRRELARLLGISFGRVQQLVEEAPRNP
jgi:hypothetical protein